MAAKRVIPCLDVKDGRVVKGVQFRNLRDMGHPAELACRYDLEGADEVVFLDISAHQREPRHPGGLGARGGSRPVHPLHRGGEASAAWRMCAGSSGQGADKGGHQHRGREESPAHRGRGGPSSDASASSWPSMPHGIRNWAGGSS